MKTLIIAIICFVICIQGNAQIILMPKTGKKTVSTSGGRLYDSGGAMQPYDNYESGELTLVPQNAGSKILLDFTEFDRGGNLSKLEIFDGLTTSSQRIGVFTNSPGFVFATNLSGALTLKFTSQFFSNNVINGNFRAEIFEIKSDDAPDLMVSSAMQIKNFSFPNNASSVSMDLFNLNTNNLSNLNLKLFLSKDSLIDETDTMIKTLELTNVKSDSSYHLDIDFISPSDLKAGYYHLIAKVTNESLQNEVNLDNNTVVWRYYQNQSFTDLSIKETVINWYTSVAGNIVFYSYQLRVDGIPIVSPLTTKIYLSQDIVIDQNDILLKSTTSSDLSVNSETFTLPENLQTGDYYVVTFVDSENTIEESNEGNNIDVKKISVNRKLIPDFVAVESEIDTRQAVLRDSVFFKCYATYSCYNSLELKVKYYLSTDQVLDQNDLLLRSNTESIRYFGANQIVTSNYLKLPNQAPTGECFIIIALDPENEIQEYSETNNVLTTPLTVFPFGCDFTVSNLAISNNEVCPNGPITLTTEVENLEHSVGTNVRIGYYLSSNSILDAGDFLLGDYTMSKIFYNAKFEFDLNFLIPSTLPVGHYSIIAKIDYLGGYNETNENNNIKLLAINCLGGSVDLQPDFENQNSIFIENGNSQSYVHHLKNNGLLNTTNCDIGYYLSTDNVFDASDHLLDYRNYDAINSKERVEILKSLLISSTVAEGTYYLLVVADHTNQIFESDESNNTAAIEVHVKRPLIDLSINVIDMASSLVYPTSESYVQSQISWTGYANIDSFELRYFLSKDTIIDVTDEILSQENFYSLGTSNAREFSQEINIPWNTTKGVYYIIAVVDYNNTVLEENELNNTLCSRSFYVASSPSEKHNIDPSTHQNTITSCSYLGEYRPDFTSGEYVITIKPEVPGSFVALQTINVHGFTDVSYFDGETTAAPVLLSSRSDSAKVCATNSTGSLTVLLRSNQFNPRYFFYSSCTNTPLLTDLKITGNTTVSKSECIANDLISVKVKYENQGSNSVANTKISLFLSVDELLDDTDITLSSKSINLIVAESEGFTPIDVTIPGNTLNGDYFIIAKIDSDSKIIESNEGNNTFWIKIRISDPSFDFKINNARGFHEVLEQNDELSGHCQIQLISNERSYPITNPVKFATYLSVDNLLGPEDQLINSVVFTSTMVLNGIGDYPVSLRLPQTATPGNYYLIFKIDNTNVIAENSELNNLFIKKIAIIPSPIDVVNVQSLTNKIRYTVGSEISFSNIFYNKGNRPISNMSVGYYLSVDGIIDASDYFVGTSDFSDLTNPIWMENATKALSSSFTIPAYIPIGEYHLITFFDYQNSLIEKNEQNNVSDIRIKVEASAFDLVIALDSTAVINYLPGDFLSIRGSYFSNSKNKLSGVKVGYYLSKDPTFSSDDLVLDRYTIPTLSLNSSWPFNLSLKIPDGTVSGDYHVIAILDDSNIFSEINEQNNTQTFKIQVKNNKLDLTVIQSKCYDNQSNPNSREVKLHSLFYNVEFGKVNDVEVNYYFSRNNTFDSGDSLMLSDTVPTIGTDDGTGLMNSFLFTNRDLYGEFYIITVVDPQNKIVETNELNNIDVYKFALNPVIIDLRVRKIVLYQNSVMSGGTVTGYYDIEGYLGRGRSSDPLVAFYLSTDDKLDPSDLFLNQGNATQTLEFSFAVPLSFAASKAFLIVKIDKDNKILEYDESNNIGVIEFNVLLDKADYIIETPIEPSASSVSIGQNVSIQCLVKNIGRVNYYDVGVGYYLSKDDQFDVTDILLNHSILTLPALNVSKSVLKSLSIPNNVPEGDYYIFVVADDANLVDELDESNNTQKIAITLKESGVNLNELDETESHFKVYPNPATTNLNIYIERVSNEPIDRLEIRSLTGALVLGKDFKEFTENKLVDHLDISDFAEGVYEVCISSGRKIHHQKITVVR